MKTMNYLFTVVFVLLLSACTSEDQSTDEQLRATKAQHSSDEEFDFLNGLEMYKRSAEVQIFELDGLIAKLSEAIDGGESGNEEELEDAQRERERLEEYRALLETFRVPRGGRGPGPRPPRGCFVANCFDGINIDGVIGISIPDETSVDRLVIKNHEGEVVGEGTELTENEFGDMMMRFETNEFEGIATMCIATRVNEGNLGEVMVEIPLVLE